jgi:hypothetical protein
MKPNLLVPSAALALTLLAAACQNKASAPAAAQQQQPPATGASEPSAELARLDQRTPVPLQPMMAWHQKQNMMDHLAAIQRITDGIAREDWEAVASAAKPIESSPQMQQMCQHMGAGARGFTEMALEFHHRADAIGEAARAGDRVAVLQATSNTLQACTNCHAAFRQEVVSAAEWQRRTGQAHGPAKLHSEH